MINVDGKKLANRIITQLKKYPRPRGELSAILVGENPDSISFLRQKQMIAKKLGVSFSIYHYPANTSQGRLKEAVSRLGRSKKTSAVIIQLPLPPRFKTQQFLDLVPVEKDVDALSSNGFGRFATGRSKILPPVAAAIAEITRTHRLSIKGKRVAVIGSGKLVGLPSAIWFANQGATILLVNEWTKNINRFTKDADIVVCGVGKPGFITANMIKQKAVIFDAGYGIKNSKPCGDCDYRNIVKKARLITPVPGGIGPLVVAMLFKNFYNLNSQT